MIERTRSRLLDRRMSGVLFHPTSLPGDGPIGTLGASATAFIDFLSASKQQMWQMLPIVPTGPGGTPYVGSSAFAGNTYLVDPAALVAAGYLEPSDLPPLAAGTAEADFIQAARLSETLVQRAYCRYADGASEPLRQEFAEFCDDNAFWLRDYALFMALQRKFSGKPWYEWPEPLVTRQTDALRRARRDLKERIESFCFGQYLFFTQFKEVKRYAAERSVFLVGDVPIYVSLDSADVWANQAIFELDAKGRPTMVAGVPPDYFSATGQRWGNPLYRWDVLKERDYGWWVKRFEQTFALFDIVRIDHFRGFESYWAIPADQPSAVVGRWMKGPGTDLFAVVQRELGCKAIIAEDLGIITDAVHRLRDELGFPGMKILQFAFGGGADHPYLPANYTENCVVYPGTHDNNTSAGWYQELDQPTRDHLHEHLGETPASSAWSLIELAWRSQANYAIAAMQDLLELGSEARMNTPAQAFGNWRWRLTDGQITGELTRRLATLTQESDRLSSPEAAPGGGVAERRRGRS